VCSGCRADANDAVLVLLPLNITVLALDFSGSGLSQGTMSRWASWRCVQALGISC